ncbi:MAG: hypothetical protein A2W93_06125 [Bacteroidetes bacterium GWF2_43_63]|nr:MAG: hypothetical protein A2W94_06715 [Bacteroidetes bacterium GWE2_42_42]OFY56196.1 MAG: hypothetical protein A2W93_06125 [Bacteroidetes bacterium GWF2_43_63]HBG70560.1 hypothetical protein [Bacteroidales bacterium]HCB61983.1 hypothetical protein [Bacteroidales bacterium]HCY22404.1 hypothetical protein [Bacteroidales bacterium]
MNPGKISLIAVLFAGSALLSAFTPDKKKPVKTPEGFVFVPMGTTTVGSDTVSVQAFFMAKTEVTNKDYREYLVDLKASGDMEAYNKALPDTLQWRDKLAYNEPYVEFYFRHPAYNDYPVVNISRTQAELYCVWLTKKMREAYGENINDARLPYREEWVMAARGGLNGCDYPWPGESFVDKDGLRCNFFHLGSENIHYNDTTGNYEVIRNTHYAGILHDAADITAPAQSYKPNGYGLYNMSGNVAEMVQQNGIAAGGSWRSPGYDVRVESIQKFDGPCTTVGFRPVITYTGSSK